MGYFLALAFILWVFGGLVQKIFNRLLLTTIQVLVYIDKLIETGDNLVQLSQPNRTEQSSGHNSDHLSNNGVDLENDDAMDCVTDNRESDEGAGSDFRAVQAGNDGADHGSDNAADPPEPLDYTLEIARKKLKPIRVRADDNTRVNRPALLEIAGQEFAKQRLQAPRDPSPFSFSPLPLRAVRKRWANVKQCDAFGIRKQQIQASQHEKVKAK